MKNGKKTFTVMLAMAMLVGMIVVYNYYLSNRQSTPSGSTDRKSEVELLIEKDLNIYYPDTAREVIKLYSSMLKEIYSTDITDDQRKELALKIRKLYDEELLDKNPEDQYLKNLYSELAIWRDADRKISNYYLDDKLEGQNTIDGNELATVYASYVIRDQSKSVEEWKYLLRKDDFNEWRILGWEVISNKNES